MPNWENVPWMVGGGVLHSVEVSRLLAYAAFGGEEGIIGPKDLYVTAPTVAGLAVRIRPGACSILARHANGAYQGYAARLLADDVLNVPAPGAVARTHLVVARIFNPYSDTSVPQPGADAAVRQAYEYVRSDILQDSGSALTVEAYNALKGTSHSAIALGRLVIPANTTSITQAMLTDVRKMTRVRRSDEFLIAPGPTALASVSSAAYADWTNVVMPLEVPSWATHLNARAIIGGARFGAAGTNGGAGWGVKGNLRLALDTEVSPAIVYDLSVEAGIDRTTLAAGGRIAIPAAMRGTTRNLKLQALKSAGNATGTAVLGADASTTISYDAVFTALPEVNLT